MKSASEAVLSMNKGASAFCPIMGSADAPFLRFTGRFGGRGSAALEALA